MIRPAQSGIAVLLLLLAGSASGALARSADPVPAPSRTAATVPLRPPEGLPLQLSRTTRRDLPDGGAIIATRTYRVTFTRVGAGWRIDGELVDNKVTAPPRLEGLAALERLQRDDSLFPMLLDRSGRIVPGSGPGPNPEAPPETAAPADPAQRDAALAMRALGMVESATKAAQGRDDQALLAALRKSASKSPGSGWPSDLFLPGARNSSDERQMALPGGQVGRVLTSMSSRGNRGVMAEAERRVETDLGGTRMIQSERWTLVQPR